MQARKPDLILFSGNGNLSLSKDIAKKLKLKNLTGNTTTATSICPRVPEEEPWDNHSNKNIAIDPGSQQQSQVGAIDYT